MVLEAHKYSSNNKAQLENDELCGCFYCLEIFDPKEIKDWVGDTDGTALCPYCGIDSVIGANAGFPINEEFLAKMREYWFGGLE